MKLRKRTINLSAGVEDRVDGELLLVANASMARRFADWMNDEVEGRPLPERGPQHVPIRFQFVHGSGSGVGVLYVHGSQVRVVAWARREADARHVQRLLAHVDYPMDYKGWVSGPAKAHDFGDDLNELPAQTLALPRPDLRPHWKRVVGVLLWSWVPILGLTGLAGYAIGWWVVGAGLLVCVTFLPLLRRSLRQ